jgi:hypothetical protein
MDEWRPDVDVEPSQPSKLTATERQVLGGLILPPDAPITAKTVEAIAKRVGLGEAEVERTLTAFEAMEPPPVHRDTDATTGIEFWIPLHEAIELLDPPPEG